MHFQTTQKFLINGGKNKIVGTAKSLPLPIWCLTKLHSNFSYLFGKNLLQHRKPKRTVSVKKDTPPP